MQGHADVVCFLIGNINERQDEEEVFWVYASIIERYDLTAFWISSVQSFNVN